MGRIFSYSELMKRNMSWIQCTSGAQLRSTVNFIAGINSTELRPFIINKSLTFFIIIMPWIVNHCCWRAQTTRHYKVVAPKPFSGRKSGNNAAIEKNGSLQMWFILTYYFNNFCSKGIAFFFSPFSEQFYGLCVKPMTRSGALYRFSSHCKLNRSVAWRDAEGAAWHWKSNADCIKFSASAFDSFLFLLAQNDFNHKHAWKHWKIIIYEGKGTHKAEPIHNERNWKLKHLVANRTRKKNDAEHTARVWFKQHNNSHQVDVFVHNGRDVWNQKCAFNKNTPWAAVRIHFGVAFFLVWLLVSPSFTILHCQWSTDDLNLANFSMHTDS